MRTDAEIRVTGMQALMSALGLVDAERFLVARSQEKFNYTEWRKTGLPDMQVEDIALAANTLSRQIESGHKNLPSSPESSEP